VTAARSADRVVRRALVAGAGTWLIVGGALGVGLAGGGGAASAAGVTVGLAAASLVTSGWLLLGLAADVLARARPPRRRLVWTAAAVLLSLLSVLLALAVGQQAALA
jgi:hypothetical protein